MKTQARRDAQYFRATIEETAKRMRVKIPRAYYAPGPGKMLSLWQYVQVLRTVLNADPTQEFKQSFSSWSPQTAQDIRRYEIWPAIHERINARGEQDRQEIARFEGDGGPQRRTELHSKLILNLNDQENENENSSNY